MKTRSGRRRAPLSAVVHLEAPVEAVFERARDASCDEGWIPDTSIELPPPPGCEDLALTWRYANHDIQLRTQWAESRGFGEALCPEVLLHPYMRALYDGVEECGIERLLAPGDADVFARFSAESEMAPLTATTSGVAGDTFHLQERRYRVTVRRCFPIQGELTMVMLPRHPERGNPLLEWGDTSAILLHVRPHLEPSKFIVTLLEQLSPLPQWVSHSTMLDLVKSRRMQCRGWLQILPRILESDIPRCLGIGASYAVVCLQKCCRGGPLLPRCVGGEPISIDEWDRFDIQSKDLSCYLNEFVRRLGFAESYFYDSLQGMRVVHFQSVVQRGAWEGIKVSFEQRFREHRSAFRRINGGRIAPELQFDVEPRFLTPSLLDTRSNVSLPQSTVCESLPDADAQSTGCGSVPDADASLSEFDESRLGQFSDGVF